MPEELHTTIDVRLTRDSFFRVLDALGTLEVVRRNRLVHQQNAKKSKRIMSEEDMVDEDIEIKKLSHLRLMLTDYFYETMNVPKDNRVLTPITKAITSERQRNRVSRTRKSSEPEVGSPKSS